MAIEGPEDYPPPHVPRATPARLLLALLFLIGTSVAGWYLVARVIG